MLQEDSNGEASFEIVDKKNEESSNSGDKTDTLSGVSSPYSLPSPPSALPGGNVLSNIQPPSNLPDFTIWQGPTPPVTTPVPTTSLQAVKSNQGPSPINIQPSSAPKQPTTVPQFSAVIPPSKGVAIPGPIPHAEEVNQGGLFGWMKDAVATGGILSKVAEKAKNSVDSLITTLDPQMTELIYSGGDIEIFVVTNQAEEVAPVREAVHAIFGKAWVRDVNFKVEEQKHQAVGFDEGIRRAEQKLEFALQVQRKPTVAIENILFQQKDDWYDLSVMILQDPERKVKLQTFTQSSLIPDDLLKQAEKEMATYAKESKSNEKLLSAYLRILNNDWQERVCGVSRRDTIYLAAKSLASMYKQKSNLQKTIN